MGLTLSTPRLVRFARPLQAALLALLALAPTRTSIASSEVFRFAQDPAASRPELDLRLGLLGGRRASADVVKSTFTEEAVKLSVPVAENVTVIPKFQTKVFQPNLELPGNGQPFPGTLWNAETGAVFRRVYAGKLYWGAGTFVGSASDKPFTSLHTLTTDTMLFVGAHHDPRNFFTAYIIHSNNRVLLNNLPLPGLAYATSLSPRWGAIVGFPYGGIWLQPTDALNLVFDADVLNLRFGARANYDLWLGFTAYSRFDHEVLPYYRAGRTNVGDRIFYTAREALAGIEWNIFNFLVLDIGGGYGLQRTLAEVPTYADRAQNLRQIDNGFLGRAHLNLSF